MSTSTDGEQLALFGAGPGPVTRVTLSVTMPCPSQSGHVGVSIETAMRERPMTLVVASLHDNEMSSVLGCIMPLLAQSPYSGATTMRVRMWAAFRRLGVAGKEVAISGCGKQM